MLAALGEAPEAARRWRRMAQSGCPLLVPLGVEAAETARPGTLVLLDAWRLGGWLSTTGLDEFLLPEAAAVARRLGETRVSCSVASFGLTGGDANWVQLEREDTFGISRFLGVTAGFAGGFPPRPGTPDGESWAWGGVAAAIVAGLDLDPRLQWDVVCGFPVPPRVRRTLGTSLFELVQRRDEIAAGRSLAPMRSRSGIRVIAPDEVGWRQVTSRPDAELDAEYPLPWERNGEMTVLLVSLGFLAAGGDPSVT